MWNWFVTDGRFNPALFVSSVAAVLLIGEKIVTWVYRGTKGVREAREEKRMARRAWIELSVIGEGRIVVQNESNTATARNPRLYLTDEEEGNSFLTSDPDFPGQIGGQNYELPDVMPPGDQRMIWFSTSFDFLPTRMRVEWENDDGSVDKNDTIYHW